ncbi:MAG: family 20 glycosylhydrolase, partial [Muribaculaceae bacterium]|nr:family 20 glycosylhydrolase [Muribaculaceae bacterium]
ETPTISWRLLPGDEYDGRCILRYTVNHADSVERILFTQLPRPYKAISEGDSIGELNAGYYFLKSPKFGTQAEDIVVDVECEWPIRSISERPESFHALTPGGRIIPVALQNAQDMIYAALGDAKWKKWVVPADSIYRLNERLATGKTPGLFDITPSFKKVEIREGKFRPGSSIETSIIKHENPEFYRITLSPNKALIEGASGKAVNMGKRMLERRLITNGTESLPCVVIEDWPDYPYRGLMIDIARNFQTPETMRKIVDLMADYRFNRLHFHVTDDEAWRLEIPGLPELTEVGGRRGYTTDSHDFLPEIFAGTGSPANNLPTANGYFTREDFIDFIKYCDSLGIAVIPEVESPGHARAAIKAMEARFRNTGDDTYRLIEDGDTSRYTTAQLYHDNLMNPALPGTYRFIEKVVDEIASMYADAGVELVGIHLGGDEVPEGAWDGSASANRLSKSKGLNGRHALQGEYVRNIARIMRDRNIPLYGWQDICTDYDDAFHAEVAPIVGGMDCWVSPHNDEDNIALKGVKAGYPVIISNVDYFYMDMLYSPHPEEKGLFWGGFNDELRTLSGYPDSICPREGTEKGKVIGVSGKLFAETIRNRQDMERLLLPKCLGLAERGWNSSPTFTPEDFNILICSKELPRLSSIDTEWHLRQPGILIENGKILMNSPYPDSQIHYTLDGTRPAIIGSSVYTGPIDLPDDAAIIQAILVKEGKASVPSFVKIK